MRPLTAASLVAATLVAMVGCGSDERNLSEQAGSPTVSPATAAPAPSSGGGRDTFQRLAEACYENPVAVEMGGCTSDPGNASLYLYDPAFAANITDVCNELVEASGVGPNVDATTGDTGVHVNGTLPSITCEYVGGTPNDLLVNVSLTDVPANGCNTPSVGNADPNRICNEITDGYVSMHALAVPGIEFQSGNLYVAIGDYSFDEYEVDRVDATEQSVLSAILQAFAEALGVSH